MRTFHQVLHVLAGALLLAALPLRAEPQLSLDEAMRLAIEQQPLLQSLDEATRASRESAVAAGQLPDPKLKLGVLNLPVTGSDAARFDRDDMTMVTVGLMQDMVPRAKREAAARSQEAAAEQFQSEKSVTARGIQRDVALAWLDVFEAERRSELYQTTASEMAAERKVMVSRISSGGAESSEVFKLDAELSMINDKRLTAQRDEKRARAALARWIGNAAQRSLGAELPDMNLPANSIATQSELDRHPAIGNARQMEAVAQSEAEQARADRELNWSWEVMYGKRRSDLSDMVSLQVAIDLPWDRPNRQDRRVAEKLLLAEKARQLTEDRKRELSAEYDYALADAAAAEARDQEHRQRLIPAAQARLSLAQAAYAAGKGNLSEVWEARRALINVEMEHWLIQVDRRRAAVKLSYLLNGSFQEKTS
jgi:cobalt-zinc-cadmium efflux system outer membrane protein